MSAGICEDDHELRGVVREALVREGFVVRATASGTEAVRAFADDPPDVLVLDVGLPDADGRDVCQALRARGVRSPVLFLSARDAVTDRVSGFHAGGDDYLTKPFALAELLVRVHALARRADPAASPGPPGLVLDPAEHAIVNDGAHVALTPTEFRLLAALAARPGQLVRRASLIAAGWPDGAIVHDNTLDAYVARIRRKLREAEALEAITTTRGVGYGGLGLGTTGTSYIFLGCILALVTYLSITKRDRTEVVAGHEHETRRPGRLEPSSQEA